MCIEKGQFYFKYFLDILLLYLKNMKIILSIILIFLIGCNDSKEYKKVKIKAELKEDITENISSNHTIKIAISPIFSPTYLFKYYFQFINYLQDKSDLNIKPIFGQNYWSVNQLIKNKKVDVAFICTGAYFDVKQDCDILVVPQINNKITYKSYIIVSKDSRIDNFNDLENKSFAFTDPLSLTGYYYVKYRLLSMGRSEDNFFSKVIYTNSHNNSVKVVAEKIVDGACVDSLVFERMLKEGSIYIKNIKVVERSISFGIPPIVVNKNIDKNIRHKLQNIFLNMHRDKEGKKILRDMSINKFILPPDNLYLSVNKVLKYINEK